MSSCISWVASFWIGISLLLSVSSVHAEESGRSAKDWGLPKVSRTALFSGSSMALEENEGGNSWMWDPYARAFAAEPELRSQVNQPCLERLDRLVGMIEQQMQKMRRETAPVPQPRLTSIPLAAGAGASLVALYRITQYSGLRGLRVAKNRVSSIALGALVGTVGAIVAEVSASQRLEEQRRARVVEQEGWTRVYEKALEMRDLLRESRAVVRRERESGPNLKKIYRDLQIAGALSGQTIPQIAQMLSRQEMSGAICHGDVFETKVWAESWLRWELRRKPDTSVSGAGVKSPASGTGSYTQGKASFTQGKGRPASGSAH